jgi:hypothetical protein
MLNYSKIPETDTVSRIEPLTDLQKEAYNSVFNPNRVSQQLQLRLHEYDSKYTKKRAIRNETTSKKTVMFNEVSKQKCPPGKSPDFHVTDRYGKSVKVVPFLRYLYPNRNTFCKNKTYPNYVWDASIDKYCCSENPEDILIRLNHLLDTLENGVGNVNINSSISSNFDIIKNEINKIFKLLFPDDTGFGDETDTRNFEIRKEVENKLDSLISENDTGLQTSHVSPSDYSEAWQEGIPRTTKHMANAIWSQIQPRPKGGQRRPSLKKNKSKKSKRMSKVNMKNTKRTRRIR